MKPSNVVKCFALVCALSMPMAAFAAGTGTGGAGGAGTGAAGTGAVGTGRPSTGAPGAGTAGTGGTGAGAGNSTNPAAASEPQQPMPPEQGYRHPVGFARSLDEQALNKRAARWRPLFFVAIQ